MKKNILYALVACLAFSFAACSDDPLDATEKHVYGQNENPYIKTNTAATITAAKQELPVQRIDETLEIKLADYAEKFQTIFGMTVDQAISGLSNGNIVFYPMNIARNIWERNSAPTKGTYGWHFNSANGVCEASAAAYSVELDVAKKALVIACHENTPVGIYTINVGFAKDNGENLDEYVRINGSFTVTDPSKVVVSETFDPSADAFTGFKIEFEDYKDAIELCMGMSVEEFNEQVQLSGEARYDDSLTPTLAMYPVKADGTWDTTVSYTADNLGYWFDKDSNVVGWSSDCVFFAQSYDGYVGFGRYYDIPKGTKIKVSFVYTVIDDPERNIEFIVSATM